tara:strand:+ start:25276 stop:25914 length:639 start_codon:yes stop_codon:yes gene_type:complete
MKNLKYGFASLAGMLLIVMVTGFTNCTTPSQNTDNSKSVVDPQTQNINMFVTHGHCSTPFMGRVENFNIDLAKRTDQGNPLEEMRIAFEVNPNTFNVCTDEELTARIKTPGLFIGSGNQNITFRTTEVFTMGLDWYQVNGKMSIKGVEKNVKLFVTGIRVPNENRTKSIVIHGKMDLTDWGIDYDKMVGGEPDSVPTKWMYLNMQVDISDVI